ncbi:MAG: hypothetical protein ACK5JE_13315 [Castellaniella sp.]|uniref:hypothetical protein n=1 Tax=Castellaniella sp. TaxID=1955812 RepID=UPI003A8494A1
MVTDAHTPINCLWCGKTIPGGRRGHGHPPKTCSEECRKARASAREKARYRRAKDTQKWQETRAAYIEKLKIRTAQDPVFAAAEAQRQQAIRDRYREKLERDPARLEGYRAKQRAWFHNLTPERREDERARNRAWYASLTQEEKVLYYYEVRRQHALNQLLALSEELRKKQ